jgi:hypothetical protein
MYLMERATFNSWKNLHPLPKQYKSLELDMRWNEDDFEYLTLGWVPRNRHDKWFLMYDDRFYIFRARSGYCVFEILMDHDDEGHSIREVRLNDDPHQCQFQDEQVALQMLRQIFRTTLKLRLALPHPEHAQA